MKINLIHPFVQHSHDIVNLLKNVNKLSTFCDNLEKQAIFFPDRYLPNDYKGHGLELFGEALIKLSPIDNRIGISNYEPITIDDVGVDGKGINIVDGLPHTVQIKYRGNSSNVLTANTDHLSNFVMNSYRKYKVPVNSEIKHMLIITTAKGLHHFTDSEMFGKEVMCLGNEDLRRLVDNNLNFWNSFRELIYESIQHENEPVHTSD